MGHELMADSEELRLKLEQTFGNGVVKDGAVDRKCLGVLVFKNKVISVTLPHSHHSYRIVSNSLLTLCGH